MAEPIPVLVPTETVSDDAVRVIAWHVASGQPVESGQLLVEVETSKAVLEICSPANGFVWPSCDCGEDVPTGASVCFITEGPEAPAAGEKGNASAGVPGDGVALPPARLSRRAAQLAEELDLDASAFARGLLIRCQDVLTAAGRPVPASERAATPQATGAPPVGVPMRWVPLTKRKSAEARVLAAGQAACLPSFVSLPYAMADLRSALVRARAPSSASACLVFEVAALLKQYPEFNATHSEGRAGLYEEVNIGWALDDGEGLVVPVIHNADSKSLADISEELEGYAGDYVRRGLSATALAGATFAISDLSGEGVSVFMPLISRGHSAILGVSATALTLAFDHQLAEGYKAAQFLKALTARLNTYLPAAGGKGGDGAGPVCSFCGGDAAELQANRAFLLRCELPTQGYVCSLCLANY